MVAKRLVLAGMSPEARKGDENCVKGQHLADIAENWRSRANENGIRVSCGADSDSAVNEPTQSDNPLGPGYVPEEALLPPPFMSTHRRPRAQSHSQAQSLSYPSTFNMQTDSSMPAPVFYTPQPKPRGHARTDSGEYEYGYGYEFDSLSFSQEHELDHSLDQSFFSSDEAGPESPLASRVLNTPNSKANVSLNHLYTPPSHVQKAALRMKGSLTEPPPISKSKPRFSLGGGRGTELFDISEDFVAGIDDEDQEQDHSFSFAGVYPDAFFSRGLAAGVQLQDPFYPQQQYQYQHSPTNSLSLSQSHSLSHSLSPTFSAAFTQSDSPYSLPPVQTSSPTPAPPSTPPTQSNACSICNRVPTASTPSYAVLLPCRHPLCSACLTAALNIVGEKDMECGVCKIAVSDFKLVGGLGAAFEGASAKEKVETEEKEHEESLPTTLEFFQDARARSSPPPAPVQLPIIGGEYAVLRIDNVPWDITPPMISTWLGNPPSLVGVHVLLDRRGKTLSHAFVEFADEGEARMALRGAQKNAVLGKGRRARGVTVTRSGQEELMRSLFPSWKGTFDGSRPSLAGLSNPHVAAALDTGLVTDHELTSLLHLIRSPDAHFLKVPALPFHSLVSLLRKFPADIDSRVFWSSGLRDKVFEVASAALQVLLWRIEGAKNEGTPESEDMELVTKVFEAAVNCAAFTSHQIGQITSLIDNTPHAYGRSFLPSPDSQSSSPRPNAQVYRETYPQPQFTAPQYPQEPFSALAREFGLEAHLVEALAQRLAAF
ncbi:hypothetical protein HWV62_14120 [Athelia sp. TMB]|nr:hypothetical protein HWV62_14120 [Athelia sp. TMB]